jgi:hypothetical protein
MSCINDQLGYILRKPKEKKKEIQKLKKRKIRFSKITNNKKM